jgi:hypothetical protein
MPKLSQIAALLVTLAVASLAQSVPSAPTFKAKKNVGTKNSPTVVSPAANLSWNSPTSGCSTSEPCTYDVYRGPTSGSETLLTSGVTTASYQDLAVVRGNYYCYEVTAQNTIGQSGYSNEVCAQIPVVPSAPGNLTVTTQ